MRRPKPTDDIAAALAPIVTIGVASALVGVRGEVRPEVIALALAATVAVAGRFGGRSGGITAALMAAISFDFMHTRPYLSLKIADTSDILITLLLLVVGLVVGGLAGQAAEDHRRARARAHPQGLTRVLALARSADPDDVESAVKAELLGVLGLADCWFTPDPVALPVIGPMGELDLPRKRFAPGGFELPEGGVAIDVSAYGRHYGYLVCRPAPGIGVGVAAREEAADLGEILGLVMSRREAAA